MRKSIAPPVASGNAADGAVQAFENCSGLRLTRRRRRTVAPFGHELVELGFVLGHAQPGEEIAKLALLLFKPAEGVGAIFVERAIAARGRATPETAAVHAFAHALHLVLPAVLVVLPATVAVISATHASAPD